MRDKGSRVRIPVSALMKKISVQLNQTTKLLTIRPDTVSLFIRKGRQKKVPVKLQGKVALDRQYYISDIILLAGFSDGLCSSRDFGYHHGCLYTGIEL